MNNYEKLPTNVGQTETEMGKITLKSVFKTAGATTVTPIPDPNRPGFYLGVRHLAEDEKKGLKYYVEAEKAKLKLKHDFEFDLSNEIDRLNWEWVKHSPFIVDSLEATKSSNYEVRFYISIESKEAEKEIDYLAAKNKAMNLVMADEPANYVSRARLLGVDMRGTKAVQVKAYLLTEANRRPNEVINMYSSDTLGIRLTVLNAIDNGLIDFDNKIYTYNGVPMGMSEDAVVDFLSMANNVGLRKLIEGEVDNKTKPIPQVIAKETAQELVAKETEVSPGLANPGRGN